MWHQCHPVVWQECDPRKCPCRSHCRNQVLVLILSLFLSKPTTFCRSAPEGHIVFFFLSKAQLASCAQGLLPITRGSSLSSRTRSIVALFTLLALLFSPFTFLARSIVLALSLFLAHPLVLSHSLVLALSPVLLPSPVLAHCLFMLCSLHCFTCSRSVPPALFLPLCSSRAVPLALFLPLGYPRSVPPTLFISLCSSHLFSLFSSHSSGAQLETKLQHGLCSAFARLQSCLKPGSKSQPRLQPWLKLGPRLETRSAQSERMPPLGSSRVPSPGSAPTFRV